MFELKVMLCSALFWTVFSSQPKSVEENVSDNALKGCEMQGGCPEVSRKSKVFPLFSLVVFRNTLCAGIDVFNGTCESAVGCRRNGGMTSSVCASGFGSCCIYRLSCGQTSSSNVTYFVNPEYPAFSTNARSCVVRINKLNPNIVQLRLDFDVFTLNGVTNGTCATDVFTVAGQDVSQVIPSVCGLAGGQHIYVNVANSVGPINLSVTTSGVGSRQWRIRVIQLERRNPSLAPAECLQYFTGFTGLFKSFNFDSPTPPLGQTNYLNNLNYSICIQRDPGSCQVRFTATPDANSFDLETPEGMSGVDGSCLGDFLYIPGSRNAPVIDAGGGGAAAVAPVGSRFCGVALSATAASIVSNPLISGLSGPIQLAFVTNGQTPSDSSDRGFSIRYQQIPCTLSQK